MFELQGEFMATAIGVVASIVGIVIPLSEKLKSITFAAKMGEARDGIAELERRLADLEDSPEAARELGFVYHQMEICHYLTEIDRLERKREHLLCGHYRLEREGVRYRSTRRPDTGLYIVTALAALLVPLAFLLLPSGRFGPFKPGLNLVLLLLCAITGALAILLDVHVLRKREVPGFRWLYDEYRSHEEFLSRMRARGLIADDRSAPSVSGRRPSEKVPAGEEGSATLSPPRERPTA